ncbi:MAG: AraC family transcriptional regulator, partial [Dongiaceae bacterium]
MTDIASRVGVQSMSAFSSASQLDHVAASASQQAMRRNAQVTAEMPSRLLNVDTSTATTTIDFLLLPNFDLQDLSALSDVLALANQLSGRPIVSSRLMSPSGEPVITSVGYSVVPKYDVLQIQRSANVFLLAGSGQRRLDPRIARWLRRQLQHGAHIGVIGAAAPVLASTGMLNGGRCAAHWADIEAWTELYSEVEFHDRVYSIDGKIVSCSGGLGSIDLAIACVRQLCGSGMANDIADRFNYDRVRDEHDSQSPNPGLAKGYHSP